MSNPLLDDLARHQEPNGLILALPTLGRFYDRGVLVPDADPANIEVLPVGIASELHVSDPLLLASGKAIPKLIGVICPQVLDAEKLCGIDIDAILMASRIASHGEMMKMEVDCQHDKCGGSDTINANLQDIILRYDPMGEDQMRTMVIPIPELEQKVCIQPPTYRTGLEIIRNTMAIQKDMSTLNEVSFEDFVQDDGMIDTYVESVERNAVMSISSLVDSIFYVETSTGEKVADKEVITQWLLRVKREHIAPVRKKIEELALHIDKISHVDYQCSKCGKTNSVRITLDPQKLFFYEPEGSQPSKKSRSSSTKSGSTRKTRSRTSQR